jgi:hypothetical protein
MKRISLIAAALAALLAAPVLADVGRTDPYYRSMFVGADAAKAGGYFVPIAKESMVRNTSGNCGYCSIEIIARHLGLKNMHGFAQGKGGCTSSSMARDLDRYGVKYKNATNRADGIATMKEFLAADCPVLFSIPGHALVCCGWTDTPGIGERIWVVDNTGREGCQIKGWTKAEFDRRFDGWVCGLFPIFPGRPWHPRTPPGPAPTPHVDPPADLLTNPLAKRVDELEGRLKALEKGDATTPGHATLHEKLKNLEGKLPEVLANVQAVTSQMGGVSGLLQKAQDDLPKLGGLVEKLKADGLLTDAKAEKAHAILDKLTAFAPKVIALEEKVGPVLNAVPWGTILGSIGAGGGVAGLLLSLFMGFAKAKTGGGADPLAAVLTALQGLRETIHAKAAPAAPIVVQVPSAPAAPPA